MTIADLKVGDTARILKVMNARLLELGAVPTHRIQLINRLWCGGVAVSINNTFSVAMSKMVAQQVEVEK